MMFWDFFFLQNFLNVEIMGILFEKYSSLEVNEPIITFVHKCCTETVLLDSQSTLSSVWNSLQVELKNLFWKEETFLL